MHVYHGRCLAWEAHRRDSTRSSGVRCCPGGNYGTVKVALASIKKSPAAGKVKSTLVVELVNVPLRPGLGTVMVIFSLRAFECGPKLPCKRWHILQWQLTTSRRGPFTW